MALYRGDPIWTPNPSVALYGGDPIPIVPFSPPSQWTDVLNSFCDDEFGVKTRQFHCCRRHGAARRRCFTDATAAATAATHVTQVTEVTVWDVAHEPSFPPGEPTAANMDNICRLRGLRPGPRGLPGPRARFYTRLERDFGRCCDNGTGLACARAAVSDGGRGHGVTRVA